ncbi:MAG: lysylphosphatidylglycerol synthase transmembrane domain-containing protein [Chloroflexota bacterium]
MNTTVARIATFLLGVVASAGLGWLVIRSLDWGLVYESVKGVSAFLIPVALAILMLASLARAFRWQLLFHKEKLSILRLFRIQNEGIGFNNLMPVGILSEATQLAILTLRDRVDSGTALATLVMERAVAFVAGMLVIGFGLFLNHQIENFTLYGWAAVGLAVGAVGSVRFLAWGSGHLGLVRRLRYLGALAVAVRDLERGRIRLVKSLLVSVVYWILVGMTTWVTAAAIDVPISPVTAILVTTVTITFVAYLPAIPGAVGTFEFAIVYSLGFFSVEREAAFSLAVIIHAMFFIPPTMIAILLLPREGVGSFRHMRKLATNVTRSVRVHGR